jgi:membrane fusion protein (multidrug efflux system)
MQPGKTFRIGVAGFLAMAIFILTGLSGCERGAEKKAPPPPPEVVVAEVRQQTVPVRMRFAGTVKAYQEVDIKPRVSGYIEQRLFEDGSEVKKGDTLYGIDPRPYQATLDSAQAKLRNDQAALKFWQAEVDRYSKLAKVGAGSVEEKQKAIATRDETIAAIGEDKADIEQAKLNLDFATIKAPFDGYVQQTDVYEGDVVTAQETVLTTLVDVDPIYVVFNISRTQLFKIQKLISQGLAPKQRTQFEATVDLPDGTPYPQKGHIDYVSARLNPNTDTLEARAVFPNSGGIEFEQPLLIPGQYIPLTLIAGEHPDALLIPQTALLETQEGAFVYVVGADDKVQKRMVTKGAAYHEDWVIEKGLKAGEKVITEGTEKIRKSGMAVQVKTAVGADTHQSKGKAGRPPGSAAD